MKMLARDWYYNDRRHVGLDFSAEAQVATHDRRHRCANRQLLLIDFDPS